MRRSSTPEKISATHATRLPIIMRTLAVSCAGAGGVNLTDAAMRFVDPGHRFADSTFV